MTVKNGKAEKVISKDKNISQRVEETFRTDDWANVVGEFAFGINPKQDS